MGKIDAGDLLSLRLADIASPTVAHVLLHYAQHCYDPIMVQKTLILLLGFVFSGSKLYRSRALSILLMRKIIRGGGRTGCDALKGLPDDSADREDYSPSPDASSALELLLRQEASTYYANSVYENCTTWCSLAVHLTFQVPACAKPGNFDRYLPDSKVLA